VRRKTYGYLPAAGHHHPLTGTKLCCFVIEAHVCEQLAQGCYRKAERPRFEPATFWVASPTLYPLRHTRVRYRGQMSAAWFPGGGAGVRGNSARGGDVMNSWLTGLWPGADCGCCSGSGPRPAGNEEDHPSDEQRAWRRRQTDEWILRTAGSRVNDRRRHMTATNVRHLCRVAR